MQKLKKLAIAGLLFLFSLFNISIAHAHCPLCTGAVGAAAVGAKYLGMDVTIIGVFIGAFAISTGLWFAKWVGKKLANFGIYHAYTIVIASFALTVLPLMSLEPEPLYLPVFITGAAGTILNKAYWTNKILFGSIFGGLAAIIAYWLHIKIKESRGKVLFPFQGIVFTILSLAATSAILYFLI